MNLDETFSPVVIVVDLCSERFKIYKDGASVMLGNCGRHGEVLVDERKGVITCVHGVGLQASVLKLK